MADWWHYLVAIPCAALLVNGVPHFVKGVSGERFPTPFSGGPGTLDTSARNVFWGAGNLIVGGILLWLISAGLGSWLLVLELLVIGVAFAALLGTAFGNPERFTRRKD